MTTAKGPIGHSLVLSADLAEVRRGREFIGWIAAEAGFPEERRFDIKVASSEAIANAIEHAQTGSEIVVEVVFHPDRLEVEVEGTGQFELPNGVTREKSHRGMGLPLMATLADHVALYSRPEGGTLVQLTFYLPGHIMIPAQSALPPALTELIEAHEELRAVLETMAEGVVISDPQARVIYMNAEALRLHGFVCLEEVTRGLDEWPELEIYRLDGNPLALEESALARVTRGESFKEYEYEIRNTKAGASWIGSFSGNPIRDSSGRILLTALTVRDVTEGKRVEEALRDTERKYRELIKFAPAAIYEIDFRTRRFTSVNDAMCAMTGYSREELLAIDPFALLTEESRRRFGQRIESWLSAEEPDTNVEYEGVRKDGSTLVVTLEVNFTRDEHGCPIGAAVVAHDITERRWAEEALKRNEAELQEANERLRAEMAERELVSLEREQLLAEQQALTEELAASNEELRVQTEQLEESEERYRGLFENMLDGFAYCRMLYDERGRPDDCVYLAVNDRFGELTGLDDVLGRKLTEVIPAVKEATPEIIEVYGRVAKGGKAERFEIDFTPLNKWLDVSVSSPAKGYFVSVFEDITERRRAEEQLRLTKLTVDRSVDMIHWVGSDGRLIYASDSSCRRFGYSPAEMLTRSVFDLDPTITAEQWPQHWEELKSKLSMTFESVHRTKAGELFSVEITLGYLESGGQAVAVAVVRDISDRKKVETALKESEERYRALAEENERLYREQLALAENLQSALLHIPAELGPLHVGHLYRSATQAAHVGGDFYDVFAAKDGKIVMLIGDVAGHGIEAARLAALTKDVIHAFAHQTLRPPKILERTNDLLLEKQMGGFVTLFLAVLEAETLHLRYANAGHPDALLRRTSGEIQLLGGGSPPLGVYPETSWKLGEVELEPGDLLLLYTDGITEARRNGEFFGEKRLQAFLKRRRPTVERLPLKIVDQVLAFSGGGLHDDVAILALLMTGEGFRSNSSHVRAGRAS